MKLYKKEKNILIPCRPETCFPFLSEKGHIVSLVGAGGKTTLLYALAQTAAAKGFRTLVTTTTHIMEPENRFARSADEVRQLWETHTYAVAGIRTADGKLKALPKESFDAYKKEAELVLIEADGSRQLPCKAPRFHEPVLLPECDTVLGVFGLKSIGMPLETVCFAPEEAKRLLSICECGHTMTPEDGVRLLSSLSGGRKNVGNRTYYAMLHQCDVPHGMEYGLEMLNTLEKNEISSFLSCIK